MTTAHPLARLFPGRDLSTLVEVGGRWFWPLGDRLVPFVAGGAGEGDGGEGGGQEGAGDAGSDGGSGDGTGTADSGAADQDDDSDKGEKLTLTQAELDALIDKRLGRAKSKWEADTKAAADRAKLDETQRLKAEKEDAEKQAADKVKGANARLVKAEAKIAALSAGVKPERIDSFLKVVDLDDVEVGDDGTVDAKAVTKAVADALKIVPEFKAAANGNGRGASGGDMNGDTKKERPKTIEDAVAARLAG